MKNHIYITQIIVIALLLIFTGCAKNQEQTEGTDFSQIKTEIPARQFIESKEFITVPFTQDDLKSVDISKISDEDGAKIKAALYRFYSNVKLTSSGTYRVSILSGEEIGISETLFSVFKANIDEINSVLTESEKEGVKYQTPEVSKEYLESLLN